MTKYRVEKVNVLMILLPIEAARVDQKGECVNNFAVEAATVDLIMAVSCGVSYTP